jgi:hypothetical protein
MRRISHLWFLPACLAGLVLIGCADFQKKYPRYPSWGWWEHPAETAEEASPPPAEKVADEPAAPAEAAEPVDNAPAAPAPALAEPGITGRADMPLSEAPLPARSDTPAPAPTPAPASRPATVAPPAAEQDDEIVTLDIPVTGEQHRQRVWQRVQQLQNLDDLPPARREVVLADARRDLPGWYEQLELPPPDPNSDDWITTLTWDFMPDEDFVAAKIKWKLIAEQQELTFPSPCSRRDLMQFIQHVTTPQPRD